MSDPTTIDQYAAARERERLGNEYREAYRETRDNLLGKTPRLLNAAGEIRDNPHLFYAPDNPDNFIEGIERDVEHELNIDYARGNLADTLANTDRALRDIRKALDHCAEEGDVEILDGDSAAIKAALMGMKLHLAALRHLTRGASPEARP